MEEETFGIKRDIRRRGRRRNVSEKGNKKIRFIRKHEKGLIGLQSPTFFFLIYTNSYSGALEAPTT